MIKSGVWLMRKTKKEKLLADLRRKIALVERKIEKPADMLLATLPEKKGAAKPQQTISFSQVVKSAPTPTETLSIDYTQISKDLRKTILISLIIGIALTTFKLLLK